MANSTNTDVTGNGHATLFQWSLTDGDATGSAIDAVQFADRCVQVSGSLNGGTVTFEGSNDGANWHPLSDPQGNPLNFTSLKIEQVLEVTRYARPRITAGTGVSVTVTALCRRNNRV